MLYNIAFQHWKAYVFTTVSPLLVDALLFLTTPCIDFQNNRNANEKEAPFSWTFRSLLLLKESLQTVCNGTNGRHATLQRLNIPPCTPVSPSRDPRPPLHTPSPNTHPLPNFFFKIFFSENFSSYKKEHTPSNEIFFENIINQTINCLSYTLSQKKETYNLSYKTST